jgi:serine/threonine protein kinase
VRLLFSSLFLSCLTILRLGSALSVPLFRCLTLSCQSENILVDDERHIRLCDFGFARAVETRGRASTVCLPVDHEVLTSRGWLDCAGWLAACASYPLLRIASYDPERDVMCFEPPVGHQTHPAVARELVQLGDEAEWAAGSGEVCYRTTEDHRLFVQPGVIDSASGLFLPSIVAPEKMPAGLLGGHGATAARHVAAARNGVGASGVAMTSGEAALLAVYGFWLLRGTTGLRFATRGDAEKKWLCDQLTLGGAAAVSVCGNSVAVEDERWALLFGARSLAESARVAEWAWTCDVTRLRQIVAGLLCAAGSSDSIVVADEQLRDDLIRLLLMSGCSASFARCDWGYRVSLAASQEELFPVASRIGRVSSSSAVWCVETPSGLLWARRARRDPATGRVTQASRPIVTGNCGTPYYSAPEVLVGKPYDAKVWHLHLYCRFFSTFSFRRTCLRLASLCWR